MRIIYWIFILTFMYVCQLPEVDSHGCGDPPLIQNAMPSPSCCTSSCCDSDEHPENTTYSCFPGFNEVGDDFRYCKNDSNWSSSNFSCSYSANEILTENSGFVSLSSFDFYPSVQSYLLFEVKACSYAVLAFSYNDSPRNDMLEIILDGITDHVRVKISGTTVTTQFIPDLISCDSFVKLYLRWDNDGLDLGKISGIEYKHLLYSRFSYSCFLKYLIIASQDGHNATWNFLTGQNVLLGVRNEFFYHSLSPFGILAVDRSDIVFQVKGCSGAYMGITEEDFGESEDFMGFIYEVLIGVRHNLRSGVRFGDADNVESPGLMYTPSILDCDDWKTFYMSWSENKTLLGEVMDLATMEYILVLNITQDLPIEKKYLFISGGPRESLWYRFLLDCGPPSAVANSTATVTSTLYNGTSTYQCDEGWTPRGSNEIQCLSNGLWSSLNFTCEGDGICGIPPSIDNGSNNASSTLLYYRPGDVIHLTCSPGYAFEGTDTNKTIIQCNNNGTWDSSPQCKINCGQPPDVDNALITPTPGDVFTAGQNVTYECNTRYVIPALKINTTTICCQNDGMWQDAPTCEANCGPPTEISHGHITQGNIFTSGEEVTYICEAGHVVQDTKMSKSTSTCQPNGTWTAPPRCIAELCLLTCGNPPSLQNGYNTGNTSVHIPMDTATIICNSGYVIEGTEENSTILVCQSDGKWNTTPNCIVNCGTPPSVNNALVTPGDVFTPGQNVTYTCNAGYVIPTLKTRTAVVVCQDDGTWEESPTCEVNCGPPHIVSNAVVSVGAIFTPGEIVTYKCGVGFVIQNTVLNLATSTCLSGGIWSLTPSCTRNCGHPPQVTQSTHSPTGSVFVPDDIVNYTCNNGYVVKDTQSQQAALRCKANGKWDEPPVCIENCGQPHSVSHASRSPGGTTFVPGDRVKWTCQSRYAVQETNLQYGEVICQADGTWSAAPVCVAYCGDHPVVEHSTVNGTGSQEGDIRTYTCVQGHTLVGNRDIHCLDTSEWEDPPECPADCGDAPSLRNGNLQGSGNLENNSRDVTCNDGYVRVGASSIKCLTSGQWETLPICQASEVNILQNQFGGDNRPLGTDTTVAMTFAIFFFILLCCACVGFTYMVVQRRRKKKVKKEEQTRPPSESKDTGSIAGSTPGTDYDIPIPGQYLGERTWRDLLF